MAMQSHFDSTMLSDAAEDLISDDDDPLLAPTPCRQRNDSEIVISDEVLMQRRPSPRRASRSATVSNGFDMESSSSPHVGRKSSTDKTRQRRLCGSASGDPVGDDADEGLDSLVFAASLECDSASMMRRSSSMKGVVVAPTTVCSSKSVDNVGLQKPSPSTTTTTDTSSSSTTAGSNSIGAAPLVYSQPHLVVERRNEKIGRALKVTQRECVTGGTKEIQTKVDVFDLTHHECPVIFSVKHLHTGLWGRQTVVHKNLLFACTLAEVTPPLDVPAESRRVFESTEQQDNLHAYLERITPFIKYSRIPNGVCLYWWRPANNGAAVLQNSNTGKLLFFLNKERTIPSAVHTLAEVIRKIPTLPDSFFEANPLYPLELVATDVERLNDLEEILTPDRVREVVVEQWALQDGIGPWTTNLVLQIEGARRRSINIRYSIGVVDEKDNVVLAIQVHKNEPLVRDLKAFPVCILQMAPRTYTKSEVYIAYKRARFFLQKLFQFHVQSEGSNAGSGGGSVSSRGNTRDGGTPRPFRTPRAQSVRLQSRVEVNSRVTEAPTRSGARTPPRATPRSRRAVSHLRYNGGGPPPTGSGKPCNASSTAEPAPVKDSREARGTTPVKTPHGRRHPTPTRASRGDVNDKRDEKRVDDDGRRHSAYRDVGLRRLSENTGNAALSSKLEVRWR